MEKLVNEILMAMILTHQRDKNMELLNLIKTIKFDSSVFIFIKLNESISYAIHTSILFSPYWLI